MKKIILLYFIFLPGLTAYAQFESCTFTGPGDVCYPQTIPLHVVNPNPNHLYQWYCMLSNACYGYSSPVSLNMGTSFIATTSGVYYFKILDQNFMQIGQSANANVVRIMPSPGSLLPRPIASNGAGINCYTSPAGICINSELINPESGNGYPFPTTIIKWYRNGQLLPAPYTYPYYATVAGYYKYSIDNGTCENFSDSLLINLTPVPGQITASGPTSFCHGDSVVLNATIQAGVTYKWHLILSGYEFSTGVTTPSFTAKTSATYFVEVINSASCTATSAGVVVSVSASPPTATITPAGSTTFCSGGNVVLNANTGNYLTYQWKKNNTDIAGAIASSYNASAAGNYTVVVTNGCGSATASGITVTVNALPNASITSAGPTTFCSVGSVVLNAVVAANRTYQWKKNNANISGAALSSYSAAATGNYKVTVTNTQTGCSKTTAVATVVTVNAKPAAAITPQGPTTFCAGGSVVLSANTGTGLTYKWKKGSNFISGATLSNYTAITAGTYRVEVTNSNGCTKLSSGVTVTVPCKMGESESESKGESEFDVKVFPNPNSGEFAIEFSDKPNSAVQIELTDELGKVVKKFETSDRFFVIKESNLAEGIYCLTVRNKNEVVIKKINVVK